MAHNGSLLTRAHVRTHTDTHTSGSESPNNARRRRVQRTFGVGLCDWRHFSTRLAVYQTNVSQRHHRTSRTGLPTTIIAVAPPGGCSVLVNCIATMARDTDSGAASQYPNDHATESL